MLARYAEGCDIVYGVRASRSTDTPFKRTTARFFYALMRRLNVSMIPDHADYRLVGRPVLEALEGYGEQSLFLRGLFPTMGFRTAMVSYARLARQAGESKYPLRKMLSFAWKGITSCSAAPLRLAGLMSFVCMVVALLICAVTLWKYAMGETLQGWTSLIIVTLLLGSVQFTEVRHRPRYIVEKTL